MNLEENSRKIVLIPGNMMCWTQFENVIPLLEKEFHVIAVSTDGYDGSGKTAFRTAEASAEKLESYIREHLGGEIMLIFLLIDRFVCKNVKIKDASISFIKLRFPISTTLQYPQQRAPRWGRQERSSQGHAPGLPASVAIPFSPTPCNAPRP